MTLKDSYESGIKAARRAYHKSETLEEAMKWLRKCSQLQHGLFALCGYYLPHSDGFIYVFDIGMKHWLRYLQAA